MVEAMAGIDIGYDTTKVVAKINGNITQKTFKSVAGVGRPFLFNNGDGEKPLDYVVTVDGREYTVGDEVIKFKLPVVNVRNKNSIKSSAYRALLKRAIRQIPTHARVFCVTGLPVSYYQEDRKTLKEVFMQEGVFEEVSVIPQPMGAYFHYAIEQSGKFNQVFSKSNIVIVDIGRYTTDIAVIVGGDYIDELSGSITVGVDYMVKILQKKLIERFPNITDESILEGIRNRNLFYYGKYYPINADVEAAIERVSKDIQSYTANLIEGEVRIQKAIVTGGGANIFKKIKIDRINVIHSSNPVMSNAFGYMKYGLFLQKTIKA